MAKRIQVGGRIESKEVGGIVTGAAEILDDAKGKKQSVINQETDDELVRLEQSKQDNLTFDNAPTEGSDNPVKSGGLYTAQQAILLAIAAINELIPSAASALNQLADKAFVNSSISTNTATFRGTSAAGLNEQQFLAWANGLTHDLNDYVFWQTSDAAGNTLFKRYKWNGTEWAYEYTLNNSTFTAEQWEAIQSGITALLVTKLRALPTAQELIQSFDSKQDVLTFDNVPTLGSNNPVKSSGIYNVIKAITDLIPAEATEQNQLADKADVAAKIVAAIPSWKGQYDALIDLQAVTGAKAGDMGCVKTTDSDGYAVLTFYQYSAQGAWVVYYTLRHYAQNKPATTGTTGDYPYNGMGRIELQKNIVNGVNTLTQAMLTQQNTIYVIQYDFTLGEDIIVPVNCVLEFDGGSLNNGNIILNNDCVIRNAKFKDVAISVSNANLKVYDSIFFYNSESNIENGISLTNASIVIEGCSFNGTVSYAYINNEGSGFAENKIVYNIADCNFTGNCQYAIRLYGTTDVESSVSSALLKDNYIRLESGNPYFLANLKNAQVYGGEYTSKTSSAASNLYSCNSAEIIGGYYHDLQRGATIGGRVGKYGIITNTINKNISYAGVDIDWASTSEAPYTYSDGYGIISNNICENCSFCCYVQGRNIKITDNIFKWGENSSNTAVRLNNFSGESDNNLIVKNNYFDFEGKTVYPVTLGNNTTCYFGDNIIKSNVINYVNLSNGAKVFELNTLYINNDNEVENYYLHKEYEKVVIDSSVSNINTFRLQTDSPKVKSTLIVNNSSRNIQLIPHSGSSLVIYGNKYLYANSSYVVTYIDNLTAIVSAIIESGIIKENVKPTVLSIGSSYFDTTLGKPIYWNGTAWVDATGATV